MSYIAKDPRLVPVPAEHREYIAGLIHAHGIPAAQKILGIGRTAMLGIVARGDCMAGTAALLREAYARRPEAA